MTRKWMLLDAGAVEIGDTKTREARPARPRAMKVKKKAARSRKR